MRLLRRKRQRVRPLSEAEAYARCHGDRDEDVRVVKVEIRRRPRFPGTVSGERLRSAFEQKLDKRILEEEAKAAKAAAAAAVPPAVADVDAEP